NQSSKNPTSTPVATSTPRCSSSHTRTPLAARASQYPCKESRKPVMVSRLAVASSKPPMCSPHYQAQEHLPKLVALDSQHRHQQHSQPSSRQHQDSASNTHH